MKNLDVSSFLAEVENNDNAVVLDVRQASEEVEGKIDPSININIMDPDFPNQINALDKSKTYYVYCRSGGRSANACRYMESQGLVAHNLEGGIMAWNQYHQS